MSYYFVANIQMRDPEEYEKYLEGCDEVFARYHGKDLAVDPQPVVLEGSWEYSRLVLIRFDSEQDFKDWYHSPEYQELLQHRLKGVRCDTILVKGI